MSATESESDAVSADERPAETAPGQKRKARLFWPGMTLVILAVAIGAILLSFAARYMPRYLVRQDQTQDMQLSQIEALEKRVAAMEMRQSASGSPADLKSRVDALEKRAVEDATGRESLSTLAARIDALQLLVPSDLPQRLETYALKTMQDSLQERLQTLEEQSSGAALHRAALALSLAELARAAGETGPFVEELASLSAASPGDPLVAELTPFASGGAKSLHALGEEFPEAARRALEAERTAEAEGFFGRLWSNIVSAVSIRRIGNPEGNESEDILARAQTLLRKGDLPGTLAEIAALKGPARQSMETWRGEAAARLALNGAMRRLSMRVVRILAEADERAP
jgi:hypothetical protein